VGKVEQVEQAPDGMVDEFVERAGPGVEGRHRREDDAAHLGHGRHVAQVREVERGFAGDQHQAAALLEHHVGRARDQVVRQAVGDTGQGFHRAGRHHHAGTAERAAGDGRADVPDVVDDVGERLDVAAAQVELLLGRHDARRRHHEVRFAGLGGAQRLQQAHAVDGAAGPGDGHDQARFAHVGTTALP
jgi:hypothetical protein